MRILNKFVAVLINLYRNQKGDIVYYKNYDYWQSNGFHIIPNHYYHPIPDTSLLKNSDFDRKTIKGISFEDDNQLRLLKKLERYCGEYRYFQPIRRGINSQNDPNFYFGNMAFDYVDALSYYGLIRLLKPKNIIEIGSGWSTKIAAKACLKNKSTKLSSIEPYPQQILIKGFPGLSKLIRKKVEDVNVNYFKSLNPGDILFIDSSHVVKTAGDVNRIFFDILPILKPGVYIHFHDIFFPFDYPKDWIVNQRRFWSEQYLLRAFMMYNKIFKTILAVNYLSDKYRADVERTFKNCNVVGGGSFWLRKIK